MTRQVSWEVMRRLAGGLQHVRARPLRLFRPRCRGHVFFQQGPTTWMHARTRAMRRTLDWDRRTCRGMPSAARRRLSSFRSCRRMHCRLHTRSKLELYIVMDTGMYRLVSGSCLCMSSCWIHIGSLFAAPTRILAARIDVIQHEGIHGQDADTNLDLLECRITQESKEPSDPT